MKNFSDEFDVIVIGGGLVGCLTALHLQEAGLRCALLERHELISGAVTTPTLPGGARGSRERKFFFSYN